jgi:ribose/xylose/arabinose/galactoside ABC-type transport system permease subunit
VTTGATGCRASRHAGRSAIFVAMFASTSQASGGWDACRAHHGGQQGRAAGLRRHGADAARADRRHRSVGRHGLRAGQLPGLAPGGGHAVQAALGVIAVLAVGALCGAINGAIVVYGRLQPIITTLATGIRLLRPRPRPAAGARAATSRGLADALTGALPGVVPAMLVVLLAVVLVVWVPYRRSVLGRAALRHRLVGRRPTCPACRWARHLAGPTRWPGLLAAIGGLLLTFVTYSGEAASPSAASTRCFRSPPWCSAARAVRRQGQRHRLDLRRLRAAHHRRPAVRLRPGAAVAAAVPGRHPAGAVSFGAFGCCASATGWSCSVSGHDAAALPCAKFLRLATCRC